ncbi:MAG TPA: nuclear transport factor 2 family protein [Gammaproteobacteria bacterium]|nr:nuclear transport factor 2 family protein [Gammaproteobacteria bacterium]
MTRPPFHTVAEAEKAFYEAFAHADADAMMEVWGDGNAVTCVHPMAPPLVGREAVEASWRGIPEGSAGLGIRVAVLRSRDSWHMVVHHASPTGRGQAAPRDPGSLH